nr:KilA-N domain-containing protein [Dyadobacter chenhuakuii]
MTAAPSQKRKLNVKGISITLNIADNGDDFISLSDVAKGFDGGTALIEQWIRNKNTIEFLGIWETINNPDFNSPEFEGIKSEAGTNRFMMSAKQWINKTHAIGISANAGRYGGTFAHKDIALEFCAWLSPEFKFLLIREFQRLKKQEAATNNHEWNLKRMLSKVNYRIHTDSIKHNLIPFLNTSKENEKFVYINEAELLNVALFGITSKEWKQKNVQLASKGLNIRDIADLHQLTVLSNLESYNAILNSNNIPEETRFEELRKTALTQLATLRSMAHPEHYLLQSNQQAGNPDQLPKI